MALYPGGHYRSVHDDHSMLGLRDKVPQWLEMVDSLDQTTRIAFSHVELNPDLDPALFEFTPPPGVDVIGEH